MLEDRGRASQTSFSPKIFGVYCIGRGFGAAAFGWSYIALG